VSNPVSIHNGIAYIEIAPDRKSEGNRVPQTKKKQPARGGAVALSWDKPLLDVTGVSVKRG